MVRRRLYDLGIFGRGNKRDLRVFDTAYEAMAGKVDKYYMRNGPGHLERLDYLTVRYLQQELIEE